MSQAAVIRRVAGRTHASPGSTQECRVFSIWQSTVELLAVRQIQQEDSALSIVHDSPEGCLVLGLDVARGISVVIWPKENNERMENNSSGECVKR